MTRIALVLATASNFAATVGGGTWSWSPLHPSTRRSGHDPHHHQPSHHPLALVAASAITVAVSVGLGLGHHSCLAQLADLPGSRAPNSREPLEAQPRWGFQAFRGLARGADRR